MQLDLGGERGKAESAFVTQRPSLGGFWNVLRTREKAVEGQRVAASRHGLTVAGSGPLDCPSAMKRSEAPSPVTPGRALETEPKHEAEEASHQTTRAVGRHSCEMSPRGEPGETERVRLHCGLAGGAREGGPPGGRGPLSRRGSVLGPGGGGGRTPRHCARCHCRSLKTLSSALCDFHFQQ